MGNRLYFEGLPKFKSEMGATLTFILVAVLFLLSYRVIVDGLDKSDRDLTTDILYNEDPGKLDLDDTNFRLGINLNDPSHSFDNAKIGVTLKSVTRTRNADGTEDISEEVIPLRQCKESDFESFTTEFSRFGLETALCPSQKDFIIQGSRLTDVSQIL